MGKGNLVQGSCRSYSNSHLNNSLFLRQLVNSEIQSWASCDLFAHSWGFQSNWMLLTILIYYKVWAVGGIKICCWQLLLKLSVTDPTCGIGLLMSLSDWTMIFCLQFVTNTCQLFSLVCTLLDISILLLITQFILTVR